MLSAHPTPHDHQSKIAIFWRAIETMHPELQSVIEASGIMEEQIILATEGMGVHYATGDSDAESVCDFDSEEGNPVRRTDIGPYYCAREPKEEPFTKHFRRIVIPVVKEVSDGRPAEFSWESRYEYPEDQSTFLRRVKTVDEEGAEVPYNKLPILWKGVWKQAQMRQCPRWIILVGKVHSQRYEKPERDSVQGDK